MKDIVCIGLMVCDIIIKPIDKAIFDLDAVRLETLKIASGGDALNSAINMSKLGLNIGLAGKVGNDALGEYLIKEAAGFGVDIHGVKKTDNCTTSTSVVMVDKTGERHFAYYGEANDSLCIDDIDFGFLKDTKIVHLGSAMALESLDGAGIEKLFKKAKALSAMTTMDVTWDSTGRWLGKIENVLKYTDIFMPSHNEAKMISGKETPEEMEEFFRGYGIKILVVKLGSKGCYVTDFKDRYYIDSFKNVKVVDTTGAGDAFVSGFLAGMIKGWGIYKSSVFGNAVAANCVMEIGAAIGIKSIEEIIKFIHGNSIKF